MNNRGRMDPRKDGSHAIPANGFESWRVEGKSQPKVAREVPKVLRLTVDCSASNMLTVGQWAVFLLLFVVKIT